MYLLAKLPDIQKENMVFKPFAEGGRLEFDTCIKSVKKFFGENSAVSKEWDRWEKEVVPADDSVLNYLAA